MGPITTALRELMAAGLAGDALIAAVGRIEDTIVTPVRVTSADESAARRRERDRIRQQERRDNLRKSAESADCPMSASTKKESIKKERKSRGRGTFLSADWTPTQSDLNFAVSHNWPDAAIETELVKFRNYWTSKTGRDASKLDWGRTWQNWVLNSRGTYNGKTYVHAANPHGKTASDVARELLQECRDEERESTAGELPKIGVQRP